jgi:hypothetical protein
MTLRRIRAVLIAASITFPIAASTTAFATSSVCSTVAGNLLVNCGFESGSFSGWSSSATSYTAVDNSNPNSGSYAADLGSETEALLTQTVTDVSGAYYSLSFELENEVATNASGVPYTGADLFYVYYENASGGFYNLAQYNSLAESNSYTQYTSFFYGSGSDTIIFIYENVPSYFELDDVVFKDPPPPGSDTSNDLTSSDLSAQAPEPSSLLLMGTGVMALAGITRRRFLGTAGGSVS